MGITRYEIGYGLLLIILVAAHFELKTMGDKKTVFDFMHHASEKPSMLPGDKIEKWIYEDDKPKEPQMSAEELRKARTNAFSKMRKKK